MSPASIKARHVIPYVDAWAMSLAQRLKASVVSGDAEFRKVTAAIGEVWLPER
jgi:hypothetical protein